MTQIFHNKFFLKMLLVAAVLLIVGFYFAGNVLAAVDDEDWMGVDLTIQDVSAIINGLACWVARVAVFIMVIFIILAGPRFMSARSEPAAFTAARKNFNHLLLGLLVILGVYVIIATVANAVGVTDFSFIPLVC